MRPGTLQFLLVLLFAASPVLLVGQRENGLLNIRNYSPKEYGGHPQNFCFTQDSRGIMYAGNNRGILQYDGYRWKLFKTRNESAVTSLLADTDNRIWVGGINEIGFLTPDATGKLVFETLNFQQPWEGDGASAGIYFYRIAYKNGSGDKQNLKGKVLLIR